MKAGGEGLSARTARFLATLSTEMGGVDVTTLPAVTDQPPVEAQRVIVANPSRPTPAELDAITLAFNSRAALAAFESSAPVDDGEHPLIVLGAQLNGRLPTKWPVNSSPRDADGTTKIRDIQTPDQKSRSLTNRAMAAHQDGWLSLRGEELGILAVTGLWAESVGVQRAATFSQNIVRLALELMQTDEAAFAALFADDAVKIIDRNGAIASIAPVLSVTRRGRTHAFFRGRNDEYDVISSRNNGAEQRAIAFLSEYTSFGANGSVFTYLDRPGRGLLLNNRHCIHGRTAFTDGPSVGQRRVIASKWWVSDDEYRNFVWE